MNKRLIYFIITGLIVLLALGGLLFYFTKKQGQQTTSTTPSSLKISKVLDERVISPIPNSTNSVIWYYNSDGRLFTANTDGSNLSEVSRPALPAGSLSSVLWPQTSEDYIVLLKNGSVTTKNYYDSTSKIFINMPSNVQWTDWLPDSKRVIYIWQATDKKSQQLVMANPDGTGFKKIADVFWPDLALKAGPSGKITLMYRTSIQGDINKIYAADLSTGQVVTLVDAGKNLSAKWLPNGNAFLYSQTSASSQKIFLFDLASHKSGDLNLYTTLDDVVVDATSQHLYAAVLKSDNSGYKFVKVDLSTGAQSDYFTPDSNTKVSSLLLVGNTVYFVSSADGKLYDISN